MVTFTYTIQDELGIHARPAGLLAKLAKSFEPTVVSITKDGKTVKASQLMKLMALAVKKGNEITVTVEGEKESEAAAAMKQFLEENL
ncbi:MAG TPA: HPr family phosphocarrier protein [Candidatus Flavonifractor merdigallinarum]|uniref:Phosphocarrier protein HPr n=1 Tax=Candidatus Flavonifractor merdigallinarum TaxID=2838589 RepID=A0A9D2BZU6_9FIRM|nr:HPr family phosphocarrier protein [Candidatus Flavonifractor merdigallinarum]